MPRCSIVIPVRNDPLRLAKLLASLSEEDWRSHEVLVIDDASTDATPEIAARYPVTLIHIEKNVGPAAARNLGVERSSADVVVFLDSDVILGPGALSRLTHWFDDPDVVGVSTIASLHPANPGFVQRYCAAADRYVWVHWGRSSDASRRPDVAYTPFFSTRVGAIRKAIFREVGGFDARFDRPCIEDAEFSLRLAQQHRVVIDEGVAFAHHWPSTPDRVLRRAWFNSRLLMGAMRRSGADIGALVPAHERIGRVLGALAALLIPAAAFSTPAAIACGVSLLVSVTLHHELFRTFRAAGGTTFTVGASALHFLVTLSGLAGAASALVLAPEMVAPPPRREHENA